MRSAGQKRGFGATIRTLNDITNSSSNNVEQFISKSSVSAGPGANASISFNNGISSTVSKIKVQHISTLPRANDASSILHRIHSEFIQIIQKRQYNVTSITEMCCCSDGLDHLPNSRRKTKLMPRNVLGYNLTNFSRPKSHAIHLRLRHAKTHELIDYESIAGTMCHELAHCVVGPHNAKFYKVMEEIEEQYALFLARGVVLDKQGFPVASEDAYRLGGEKVSSAEARRRARLMAEKRRGLSCGQFVLGGSTKIDDPKEAARIAAERRLRDSQFCLPCNEVIELLGEDSDDENFNIQDGKMKSKPSGVKSDPVQVIDLTDETPADVIDPILAFTSLETYETQWECACCTLINQPTSLICDVCDASRNMSADVATPDVIVLTNEEESSKHTKQTKR